MSNMEFFNVITIRNDKYPSVYKLSWIKIIYFNNYIST